MPTWHWSPHSFLFFVPLDVCAPLATHGALVIEILEDVIRCVTFLHKSFHKSQCQSHMLGSPLMPISTQHWRRRVEQSMIHIRSTCLGFGGSWLYLLVNSIYNAGCCRRQFRPIVRPKMNRMRILVSMLAYTVPLLVRDGTHFCISGPYWPFQAGSLSNIPLVVGATRYFPRCSLRYRPSCFKPPHWWPWHRNCSMPPRVRRSTITK
jgi:hypothetical protein